MKQKGKRFREEEIIYALREVQGGRKIAEICREVTSPNNTAIFPDPSKIGRVHEPIMMGVPY